MGSFKSGERVTIFGEQESRRGREEVVSYTALFFFLASGCVKIETKAAAYEATVEA